MPYIMWRHAFSVGIQSIDEHHKKILDIINELYEHMQKGTGEEEYKTVIRELKDYASFHFIHEETLMFAAKFPGAEVHKANHEEYRKKVDVLAQAFKEQPEDLMVFLKEWWSFHILRVDAQYKEVLVAQHKIDEAEKRKDKENNMERWVIKGSQ
jgi:hemerythrin-like metal-binding protein